MPVLLPCPACPREFGLEFDLPPDEVRFCTRPEDGRGSLV